MFRKRRILIKVEMREHLRIRKTLARCLAILRQEVKQQQHMTLIKRCIEKRRNRRGCQRALLGWTRYLEAARTSSAAERSQARLERGSLHHALLQWAMLILAGHVQREERARHRHKSIVRMLRGSNEVKLKILHLNVQWLVPGLPS